jgi:hypothetical protein
MTLTDRRDRLYELLPALYRESEERAGRFPLRDLLRLITEQAEVVRADIGQLWNNFFIETSEQWAVPYIGDLVANNLLHDGLDARVADTAGRLFDDLSGRQLGDGLDLLPGIAVRTRADVAKTIYYRRRKGTPTMLEELARDVTGWGAHVVEFFALLDWAQNLNHVRGECFECADLRRPQDLDLIDGPFDKLTHSPDVRPIEQQEGWYNIPNIGFFLWRLRSYPLVRVRARRAGQPWQFHFSPLGNAAPLFSAGRREDDEIALATELDVPGPIRGAAFYDDLVRYQAAPPATPTPTDYYGDERSFRIIADGVPVDPVNIRCRRLGTWTQPPAPLVAVDVGRGRIAFGNAPQQVDVDFHYGFSADLGGGPYDRSKWFVRPELAQLRLSVRENGVAPEFPTIGAALAAWVAANRPDAIITIRDNRTYAESLHIELADDSWLVIEADNRVRPHLRPVAGEITIDGDHPGSEFTLSGLLVEGAVHVTGDLARLRLLHTTLVPGRGLTQDGAPATQLPSLVAEAMDGGRAINTALRVQIAYSITGPIQLPVDAEGLWLLDSIVDGLDQGGGAKGTAIAGVAAADSPGPPATLERTTVFGASFLWKLPMATEVLFTDAVTVTDRQEGCVRFSYVAPDSATPRRYRCQPNTEIESEIALLESTPGFSTLPPAQQTVERDVVRARVRRWLVPTFTALDYGQPGYAQLRLSTPEQIRTGAEDASEMGGFCHLKQPQRATNLRIRLDEYLPFGLDAGLIYVT